MHTDFELLLMLLFLSPAKPVSITQFNGCARTTVNTKFTPKACAAETAWSASKRA
jgi:hypothetical protein